MLWCGYAGSSLEVKIETDSGDAMEIKTEDDSSDTTEYLHDCHQYAGMLLCLLLCSLQSLLQRKCRPQNLVFSDISFMAILAGVTPSESDKVRHSALVSETLTNKQP